MEILGVNVVDFVTHWNGGIHVSVIIQRSQSRENS